MLPTIGVGWYTEENWTRIKATAVDPERFESTFGEWTAMAEGALADLKGSLYPTRVHIDADEFASWCAEHGKENSAATRAEFVSGKVRERDAND